MFTATSAEMPCQSIDYTSAYALANGCGWVLIIGDAVLRAAAQAKGPRAHNIF